MKDIMLDFYLMEKRRTKDVQPTYLGHNCVERKTYVSKLSSKFDAKAMIWHNTDYQLINVNDQGLITPCFGIKTTQIW